ncbi:MAG: DNA polymerase III subunit delta [Myxococcota bacterium]
MSDDLEEILSEIEAGGVLPLYLVWGEEFLARKGAEALIERLVPEPAMGLNCVALDGASPREVAQELATLPLFPGRKVVFLKDPENLVPKKGRGDVLGRAREAWKSGRRKEGARRVLSLAARAGWSVAELDPSAAGAPGVEAWREELNVELADADVAFLREVAALCREEGMSAPEGDDSALVALVEKGLPKGHALVICATEVDPKHTWVRLAKEAGRVIERKVASRLKDLDVAGLAHEVLAPYKKRLAPQAAELLKERCGGNMRLLQSELEKLALYAEGQVIQLADVDLLVGHAREEEFMELSDALQKRDLAAALAYADEALGKGAAPLALLGAVASVVRTLLVNAERLAQLSGGRPPRSFDDFKARLFSHIEAEAKSAKARVPHPYAAFMGMQAAARYGRQELLAALAACAESDLALKLGGGRLVVERLLWTVCGKAPPWDSGLAQVRRELERG